jgi:glycosyltransferase involved in cell wall biosynthesis
MGTQPKRVLYVEGNLDGTIGGSYFSLLYLVSGLDRARFEPLVVFAADTPLRPRFEAADIRTLLRPMTPGIRLTGLVGGMVSRGINLYRGWVRDSLSLAALLRRERIDLVHLNNTVTGNHPWMIGARLAGIPCITHERGINVQFSTRTRLLARSLKAVVCISSAVRDNLLARGFHYSPLVTIHNGLDPDLMHVTRRASEIRAEIGIGRDVRLIGMVGNIKSWKGQEVVIRAMAILRDEFPNVVCLLIGHTSPSDAAYRDYVASLIESQGLLGRVIITGHRVDIANYVAALEIQIHASIEPEPFGRVLLEGMALQKPLVASGSGAVPEIVVDGQTGLLFEPGRPEALATALRQLLNDPARAAAMGAAGRERLVAEFSVQHNIRETQALYDSLLGSA